MAKTNKMVKFIDYKKDYLRFRKEYDQAWKAVNMRGDLILRSDVKKFEQRLAKFLGVKYAVALNSGTDALELALRALKIGQGDEVITVSNTFKATITAIRKVGAIPVLVDIGEDYLMDVSKIKDALTDRTKAIIPVHLSGDTCDMPAINDFAIQNNLKVIEDSAQALGAKIGNFKAGHWGEIGCFSFYPAKLLGAKGDAGALVTDSQEIADWVRNYRNHCKDLSGEDGINSRMDNLQAALLNVKIKYIKEILHKRKKIAWMYNAGLRLIDKIILPKEKRDKVWQDYVIRAENRDRLYKFLKNKGIETMKSPILPHIELNLSFKLPKTEEYNEQFLRLPCNENLENKEIEEVIKQIKRFYAGIL